MAKQIEVYGVKMTEIVQDISEPRYNHDNYATHKDLRILSLEIEQKILQLKIELEIRITAIESSLFKKLGSLILATSTILFALLSYFHK